MSALIWIDSAPLIRAEHKKYLAAVARLKASQDRLTLHEKSDEPRYSLWVQTEFASEISNMRVLHEKYVELEEILEFVEDFVRETGASPREGYLEYLEMKRAQDLMRKMRERTQAEPEDEESGQDDSDAESDDDSQTRGKGSSEESFDRQSHSRTDANSSSRARSSAASRKADQRDADAKQLYRQLAKRLHPDMNGGLSPEETEMWFEVQQAYEDRDLSRLEALLAIADRIAEEREASGAASAPSKIQSLGRLKSMLKSLASKLRNSQRALKKAKQSPAWNFHAIEKDSRQFSKLKLNVSADFERVVRDLHSDVRKLERVVARLRRE